MNYEIVLQWYIAVACTTILVAGVLAFMEVMKIHKKRKLDLISKLTQLLLSVKLKGDSVTAAELADKIYTFLQRNKLLK